MANYYVYSGAAGAGTGADWVNAYTTLTAACAGKAAGDVFYVAHDHAETQASAMTVSAVGSTASPCRIYCVNRAGSVPPVSADLRTTATITTTGAFAMSINGLIGECYGIIFSCGTGATGGLLSFGTSAEWQRYVNCSFRIASSNSSTMAINLGSPTSSGYIVLENVTFQTVSTATLKIFARTHIVWRNTPSAILGSTVPNTLLTFSGNVGSYFLEGVDLSALGSGKFLVDNVLAPVQVIFKDCKLGASVSVLNGTFTGHGGMDVQLIRCDSGDTNYRTERYDARGTQTTETTIVRSGGASDGTTPISTKLVTTTISSFSWPFEMLPISIWNETVGSPVTITIQGVWGGGAVPNNDNIWIDVEYLGTSGFPLASRATSAKADALATASAIPAGTGTWAGSTTKFAMSATFTPQEKGPITIYVKAALASTTFYVDPKPLLS